MIVKNMGKMHFYEGKIVPSHFSLWKDCRQKNLMVLSQCLQLHIGI